jgi:hypothetical protein
MSVFTRERNRLAVSCVGHDSPWHTCSSDIKSTMKVNGILLGSTATGIYFVPVGGKQCKEVFFSHNRTRILKIMEEHVL